jgi:Holliday junction resolvasome RuvABC endonuclease subunit
MTPTKHRRVFTMAIHPTSRGFGWIVFEGPFSPHDWGVVLAKGHNKNSTCLRKLETMLARFTPETLVVEAFDKRNSFRTDRIANLCQAAVSLAVDRGVDVAIYNLADIRSCFATVGARTRQEIAEAVVRHVDAFRHRLPTNRKPWQSEDRRMALFSAAALALTHYQRGANQLFNDLDRGK